jgi:hypothetical protein
VIVFYHLLIAVGGVVALVGVWIAVQNLVRRESPELPETADVMACGMCGPNGECYCGLREAEGAAVSRDRG